MATCLEQAVWCYHPKRHMDEFLGRRLACIDYAGLRSVDKRRVENRTISGIHLRQLICSNI